MTFCSGGDKHVMKWMKGSKEGIIVADENGQGEQSNQFNSLRNLSYDRQENRYVDIIIQILFTKYTTFFLFFGIRR
jgi:hypothetical protein